MNAYIGSIKPQVHSTHRSQRAKATAATNSSNGGPASDSGFTSRLRNHSHGLLGPAVYRYLPDSATTTWHSAQCSYHPQIALANVPRTVWAPSDVCLHCHLLCHIKQYRGSATSPINSELNELRL